MFVKTILTKKLTIGGMLAFSLVLLSPPAMAAPQVTPDTIVEKGATSVQMRSVDADGTVTDTNRGYADNKQSPLVNQSRFRAGSTTKLFTTTAIMKLVEEGKVNLEAPVETYLPGKLTFGNQVTVRQVLSHTSGLPITAYEAQLPFDADETKTREGMQKMLEQHYSNSLIFGFINKTGLKYTPGSTWEYSNANFFIAGQVIASVTGKPYRDYVEQTIMKPLNLSATTLPQNSFTMRQPYVRGYQGSEFYSGQPGGEPIDLSNQSGTLFSSAGALVTTTGDLTKFLNALYDGKIISQNSLNMMAHISVPNPLNYGLGTMQVNTPCGVMQGHNGNVYGYTTIAMHLGKKSVAIAVAEGSAPYSSHTPDAEKLALGTLCPEAVAGQASVEKMLPSQLAPTQP